MPVMEKYDEFERLMRLAAEMDVRPRLGVRVHLATRGSGKWAASSGDRSKFGISRSPNCSGSWTALKPKARPDALSLLHFHLGSQIADIQTLKQAVKEITQVYAQLYRRGVRISHLDVGGGLGVSYEVPYSGREDSINYTLQEYANSVVYAVKEVCDAEGRAASGARLRERARADGAPLGPGRRGAGRLPQKRPRPGRPAGCRETTPSCATSVRHPDVRARDGRRRERRSVACLKPTTTPSRSGRRRTRCSALATCPSRRKGLTESLFWSVCYALQERMAASGRGEDLPSELHALADTLVDQYLCDFSVFQSILDHWAIGQRFPIMPLARLDEAAYPPRLRSSISPATPTAR